MFNPHNLRIRTFTPFIFSIFRSRKKCEETTREAKGKVPEVLLNEIEK